MLAVFISFTIFRLQINIVTFEHEFNTSPETVSALRQLLLETLTGALTLSLGLCGFILLLRIWLGRHVFCPFVPILGVQTLDNGF